jgi:hypothetical protein
MEPFSPFQNMGSQRDGKGSGAVVARFRYVLDGKVKLPEAMRAAVVITVPLTRLSE